MPASLEFAPILPAQLADIQTLLKSGRPSELRFAHIVGPVFGVDFFSRGPGWSQVNDPFSLTFLFVPLLKDVIVRQRGVVYVLDICQLAPQSTGDFALDRVIHQHDSLHRQPGFSQKSGWNKCQNYFRGRWFFP
jgi:hypothetical protein